MTTTTHIDALHAIITTPARLRSWSARMRAKDTASRYLAPLMPAGSEGWLVMPTAGESAKRYTARVVSSAAAAAAWAGGLADGTPAPPDAAVLTSIGTVLGR